MGKDLLKSQGALRTLLDLGEYCMFISCLRDMNSQGVPLFHVCFMHSPVAMADCGTVFMLL